MDVAAAVFTEGDLILACRRAAHLEAGGRWEFPGGKLEDSEAPEAALEREIAEELGVEIEVGQLLDRTTSVVDGTSITLSCYFVRALGQMQLTSTDHDVVAWFPRQRMVWLNWAEPDRPAVWKLYTAR